MQNHDIADMQSSFPLLPISNITEKVHCLSLGWRYSTAGPLEMKYIFKLLFLLLVT